MRGRRNYIGLCLLALLIISCKQEPQDFSLEEGNAVYYWRTDLRLDSTERTSLQQYHINKVYCRLFDVVLNDESEGPMPNATLTFSGLLPNDIELIPTVYITENCMHKSYKDLAEKIVKRILQMNETNNIKGVHEIQIDCDYTARSRMRYFEFLKEIASFLPSDYSLSTTIRLHQLSMEAPPVDYGVLMLYNTGDPRKFQERNPILDIRDVQPYLKHLSDYPLPMAAAYPVFSWLRIINGVHIEHTVEAEDILHVKQAVEQKRQGLSRRIITYHLDQENINRYKPKTYEEIYHH